MTDVSMAMSGTDMATYMELRRGSHAVPAARPVSAAGRGALLAAESRAAGGGGASHVPSPLRRTPVAAAGSRIRSVMGAHLRRC
jgi:hypothetical protein